MSLSENQFSYNCAKWNGCKPCLEQKEANLSNCLGCVNYVPVPDATDTNRDCYNPEVITTANDIGIVELGGLGSILRTTAVTSAIHNINPISNIYWFIHSRGVELLKYVPGVKAIDVEKQPLGKYVDTIKGADLMINFDCSDVAKDIVSRSRMIGGFALSNIGKFHGVMPYAEYMQQFQINDIFRSKNELTMQKMLLKTIGLDYADAKYDILLKQENYDHADKLLSESFNENIPEVLIGLNIGTSEKGKLRRWPAESFSQLAIMLASKYHKAGIMVLSGPDDEEPYSRFISQIASVPDNVKFMPRDLEIGDFIAMVSKLSLLVTADTFAFHAAKSQDIGTVLLVGPIPSGELETNNKDIIIRSNLDCLPCYHKCSRSVAGKCMHEIHVDEVYRCVSKALDNFK